MPSSLPSSSSVSPPSSVSLKVGGSSIKWMYKFSNLFTLNSDDNKWVKIIIISSSIATVSFGAVLLAKKYLIKSEKTGSKITNGKLVNSNDSNYYECISPDEPFNIVTSSSHLSPSKSSSTSTLVGGINMTFGQHQQEHTLDGQSMAKLLPCVSCSSRSRRLSWRSSLSTRSNFMLSPQQTVAISSDSLSSTINLCENMMSKLMAGGDVGQDNAVANKLNEIIEQLKSASKELDKLKEEYISIAPPEEQDDEEGDTSSMISTSTLTYYWDVEPNLHFFKLYQKALEEIDSMIPTRLNRSQQVGCETEDEFKAKVHCLRQAFRVIFEKEENINLFISMGKEILEILMKHTLRDPAECLAAYSSFINYVSDSENHPQIEIEIENRNIHCLSFYDVVLDYIIMESLDDLENPPAAVTSVANNRWLSAGFRELALQTAVSAVMRHKRTKLIYQDGFFAHFYAILDHISPILAWGFLGSDQDLKLKCLLVKESLLEVIRDYFSFDRVRYTSLNDLTEDILRVTKERYWELNNKLSILAT